MSSLEELNYKIGINANVITNTRKELDEVKYSGHDDIWAVFMGDITPRHSKYESIVKAYTDARSREEYFETLLRDTITNQIELVNQRQPLIINKLNELIKQFNLLTLQSPRSLEDDVKAYNHIVSIIEFNNSMLSPMFQFKEEIKFYKDHILLSINPQFNDDVESLDFFTNAENVENKSVLEINSLMNYKLHECILRNKIRLKLKHKQT